MVRNRILIAGAAALAVCAQGCLISITPINGSGIPKTRVVISSAFNKVSVSHACKATIRKGATQAVTITIDDNLAQYVHAEYSDSTLDIHLAPGANYYSYDFSADITVPDIKSVAGSGASEIALDTFTLGHAIAISLSGASDLVSGMSCANATLQLSGASDITLTGSGQNVTMDCSGASTAILSSFECVDVKADLSGASTARVYSTGRITGDLSGASDLYYSGPATMGTIGLSGGSETHHL